MKNTVGWLRFLLWSVLICGGLSLVIALLDRWVQLHRALALVSPLLAIVVSGIFTIGFVGGVLYFGWKVWPLFRPKLAAKKVNLSNKSTAATANLEALEQQVEQIKDRITREALQSQSENLKQTIERQEPQIVVFGVGSSGKTSLVNALLQKEVGETAPTMGTTELGTKYRPVKLNSVLVSITDCPGILEVGIAGTDREQLARKIAARADLLLFVIDDDLRQTEFETLQELAHLGKTMILVFNKTDRFTSQDKEQIIKKIQQRLIESTIDIPLTPIAANPSPVSLPSGEIYQSKPKLTPLLQAIEEIFQSQLKELIADNILLQCQTLQTETQTVLNQQREQLTQTIIDRYQWIVAGAVVATPIPLVDLLAAAAVNTQMVIEIGKVYDCTLSFEDSQTLVGSLTQTLTGLGLTRGALQMITTAFTITPVGLLLKSAIGATTAAYLTKIAGKSFQQYFQQQQQWGDGGIGAVVKEQFNLQKRESMIRTFIAETIKHLT